VGLTFGFSLPLTSGFVLKSVPIRANLWLKKFFLCVPLYPLWFNAFRF
jgi:hypothetical protein